MHVQSEAFNDFFEVLLNLLCQPQKLKRLQFPEKLFFSFVSSLKNGSEALLIIRIEKERCLGRHPELRKVIPEMMVALLKDKPKEVLPYDVVFLTSSRMKPDEPFTSLAIVRDFQIYKNLSRH
jgi:hypothetical protein